MGPSCRASSGPGHLRLWGAGKGAALAEVTAALCLCGEIYCRRYGSRDRPGAPQSGKNKDKDKNSDKDEDRDKCKHNSKHNSRRKRMTEIASTATALDYQRERFPLAKVVPLLAAFSAAGLS